MGVVDLMIMEDRFSKRGVKCGKIGTDCSWGNLEEIGNVYKIWGFNHQEIQIGSIELGFWSVGRSTVHI